jgi:hypothetical protein
MEATQQLLERRPGIFAKLVTWLIGPSLPFPEPTPPQSERSSVQRTTSSKSVKLVKKPPGPNQDPVKYATWPPSKSSPQSSSHQTHPDTNPPPGRPIEPFRPTTPAPWFREPSLPKESGNPISPLYAAALYNTYHLASCQNKPFMASLATVTVPRYRRNRKTLPCKTQPTAVPIINLIPDTNTPFRIRSEKPYESRELPTISPRHDTTIEKGLLTQTPLSRPPKLHPHPNRQKHLYPRTANLNGLWHKRPCRNRIQQLDLCVALPRARHVLIY